MLARRLHQTALALTLATTASLMFATSASATVAPPQYTYSFSAQPDGWQPINFSFTVPNLLQAGDAFSFTAFTISDGVNNWLIDHGTTTTLSTQGRCFLFASAGIVLPNGAETECGLGTPSGGANFWFFDGATQLPTAPGVINGLYVTPFSADSAVSGNADFNGKLSISAVPELSGGWLLLAGLGLVALRRRPA